MIYSKYMMRKHTPIPPEHELVALYKKEGSTISSLARHYATNNPTVRGWLIKYGVERKSHRQASAEANNRHKIVTLPSREELIEVYTNNSLVGVSKHYSVGQQTIYEWLDYYDIPRRDLSSGCVQGKKRQFTDKWFDKETIELAYDRTQPLYVLSETLNISKSHLLKLMSYYNIERTYLPPKYRSKAEIELFEWCINTFSEQEFQHTNRSLISPFEIDIVNHTKKIAIEFCGLYWHSEFSSGKPKDYHQNKMIRCNEAGFRLITVFESDDMKKVKALLSKLFGITTKVFARKCKVIELTSSVARKFHTQHHLSGAIGASHHYGLIYDNELVLVGSFGKNRFGSGYECARMTCHSNISVVGGISKLIHHFIKIVQPDELITFVDLRFGSGNSYIQSGFKLISTTLPNYFYWKKGTTTLYSRVKFQKHKLNDLLEHFDETKSEFDNMINNGYDRIWDCGNAKFASYKRKGEPKLP
jgi:transposase-like protein